MPNDNCLHDGPCNIPTALRIRYDDRVNGLRNAVRLHPYEPGVTAFAQRALDELENCGPDDPTPITDDYEQFMERYVQ